MYVITGNTTYTAIRNLSFAPEVDVTCQQIQSNEFSVEIITDDTIYAGAQIGLYDDSDNVWANYWIYDCYRVSAHIWRVVARDLIWRLDNIILPAVMYDEENAGDVISAIFYGIGYYYYDSSLANAEISGYLPEQTARERLQEICFTIGAYVNTCFCSSLQILELPTAVSGTAIPANKIFMSPTPSVEEPITAFNITWYQYRETTEEEAKENKYQTVTVDGVLYAQLETVIVVESSSANRKNEINIGGITIIDGGNVWNVINRLALIYFNRQTISFECINNGEYKPGSIYTVPTGIGAGTITGYITSADFTFGENARSTVELRQASTYIGNVYTITFNYLYNSTLLDSKQVTARLSTITTNQNPVIDKTYEAWGAKPKRRIVYYPEEKYKVVQASSNTTVDINYDIAVKHTFKYKKAPYNTYSVLQINEVNSAEQTGSTLVIT